jgi:hypothetical protein
VSLRRATWLTSEHVVHLAVSRPLYVRPDGSVGAIALRCKMIYYAKSWLEWTYKKRKVTCLNCLRKMA